MPPPGYLDDAPAEMVNPARLFIGNIGYSVPLVEIERRLSAFGTLQSLMVSNSKEPGRKNGGYAFVEYVDVNDANRCKASIHSAVADSQGLHWIARTASPKAR